MLDTIAPNEPPTIVRSADRRRRRGVRPHTTDSGHGPQIGRIPSGWLAPSRLFPDATADDYLARHSEFLGPVKLRRGPQGILRQVEVFLPPQSVTGQLCTVDPEQAEEAGRLRDEIQTMAEALLDGQLKLDAWNPPDLTTLLAGWLAEQGCDAIADKEGNLRLTIRGEGCDGQVRIECGADRLRLVMPLGQWTQLSPTAAMAIRLLAAEANDRTPPDAGRLHGPPAGGPARRGASRSDRPSEREPVEPCHQGAVAGDDAHGDRQLGIGAAAVGPGTSGPGRPAG